MPHAFFETWTVKGDGADPFADHSFVIQGSAESDGRYVVPFLGPAPQVTVRGFRWTVRLEYRRLGTAQWIQDHAFPGRPDGGEARTSTFDPKRGLVMHVGTGSLAHGIFPKGAFRFSGMRIELTPQDPDLSPGPLPPPPDFSIPTGPD